MSDEQRAHPDCRNASTPDHERSEDCFTVIAEAKARMPQIQSDSEEHADDGDAHPLEENEEGDFQNLTGRKKKTAESRKKLAEAKKQNQTDIMAEKKRLESRPESRGISKQKWVEERKKRIGKLLDANGLDMKSAYMLDTQEMAEAKYKKWEKDPAPVGWDGLLYDFCSLIRCSFIVWLKL